MFFEVILAVDYSLYRRLCSLILSFRILDPLISSLLSPKIKRVAKTLRIADLDVHIEQYQHVFDISQIRHILENLLSLASFGGQGFTRLTKTSAIKQSPFAELKSRADAGEVVNMEGVLTC